MVAIMATVLYGALVICADGFISLLTNQDVVGDQSVGPLIAPVMGLVACALVFSALLRGLRIPRSPLAHPGTRAVVTAILVYVLGTMTGALLFAIGRADVLDAVLFLARYLASPFMIAAAVLALLIVALVPIIATASAVREL
jgi:hypothetical protein